MAFSLPFSLPFAEAVEAAKRRGVLLPEAYYQQLPESMRSLAFSISGMTQASQIQAVLDSMNQAMLSGGDSYEQWKAHAVTQGWQLTKNHLDIIARNHIQTAYQAGHWRQIQETKGQFPYLRYNAVNDGRTRPSHRAMHGVTLAADDPFWQTHAPPNGHRCRCTVIQMTAEQAKERGITRRVPRGATVDPGWNHHPLQGNGGMMNGPKLGRVVIDKLRSLAKPVRDRLLNWLASKGIKVSKKAAAESVSKVVPIETLDEFIAAGRAISEALPDASSEPEACHRAILSRLKAVGVDEPCQVSGRDSAAKAALAAASQRYPNSWTRAADEIGPLFAMISDTRGFQYSHSLSSKALLMPLEDFGYQTVYPGDGYIKLDGGGLDIAVHEYAHRLQFAMPELDRFFQQIHRRRTQGEPLERLKDLLPDDRYDERELTRPDGYFHPYQGREYTGNVASEVMTMAMQAILAADKDRQGYSYFQAMYAKDREMFDLTLGLLFHWRPK